MIGPRDTFEVRAVVTASVGDGLRLRLGVPFLNRVAILQSTYSCTKVGAGVHVGDPQAGHDCINQQKSEQQHAAAGGQELPRIATAISQFVQESCIRGNTSLDAGRLPKHRLHSRQRASAV